MSVMPKSEIELSLFSPYSQLSRFESGLKRTLRFEATFEDRTALRHLASFTELRAEAAVLLEESDDLEDPGWVSWAELDPREGQSQSKLLRYLIRVPLERYAIDFADSFHSRGQKLLLTLKLIANADLVSTRYWHHDWDVNRVNPQPVRVLALRFSAHHL
jgi:hypothetical protein